MSEGMAEIRLEDTEQILTGFHMFYAVHLVRKNEDTLTGSQRKFLLFHCDSGGTA